MRTLFASLVFLIACSVPDKQPVTSDGGTDAGMTGDVGEPDTTITSAPAEFSNQSRAAFEFESNDPTAHFTCSLDGKAPEACTSPFAATLADGTHSFSVKAISAGGDADDSPAEHLWSIDTVAPETTLTEAPPDEDNSTMVRFSFMSNEMNTSFECRLDAGEFTTCRSGDEFGPIGDGAHSFAVRAKDRAGNVDASPAVHTWSVDTSTPDTTLISGPSGAISSNDATFTFLSPDAGPDATFQCSLDGAPFAACTSPQTYNNLDMGTHTFSVRVRDAGGNFDPTPATRTWIIDADPPQTTIDDAPSGTVAIASAIISFSANEANVTYTCSFDGGPGQACTSPFSATNLAQGPHSFSVAATDAAGNTDPSPATAQWTVDTVSPDIALTGPNNGDTVGPRVSYSFTTSEGVVECRIAGGDWAACSSPRAFNLPAGDGNFEIRATDAAGNVTSLARSFTVACVAPDTTGAAGLLHLDEDAQVQTNATGGANATLGPTDQPEPQDPAIGAGRFGNGAVFTAADSDVIAWPLGLGATSGFTLELWSRPDALGGTRDVAVSGDGRIAIRVTADAGNTVRYSATVADAQNVMHTVTSGTYAASAWHLIDVSFAEPALRLWVDGDRSQIDDARIGTATALDAVQLGGTYGGALDEVYLSGTPLATDDAVLARYCPATTPRP
jgi:hypothetical protein